MIRDLDPRRSLVGGIIWLMVALAASFAIAASLWAGSVAREIVVQQHVRRLALETQQLASDLGQAVSARLEAVRSSGVLPEAQPFEHLRRAYPDLDFIAVADTSGTIVAGENLAGASAAQSAWFRNGLSGLWIGLIEGTPLPGKSPVLGDMSAPLRDSSGRVVGVIAAHLTWPWASADVEYLSQALNPRGSAQSLVLSGAGMITVGPPALRGAMLPDAATAPHCAQLPDGVSARTARAAVRFAGAEDSGAWQVQLSEPREFVYQRANALAVRIWWISLCLGAATAVLGALAARHLTNRLRNLTRSAAAVGRSESARIEVPAGHDEVAQLAGVFAKILDDLHQERSELLNLSSELERRVAIRTREVERLAEELRYAPNVSEGFQ